MKKHLALAAAAVALAGAAAVPAGSAFAKTKKPPSAAALAIHCGILENFDNSLDAAITAASDPTEKAFLEALEESNDAKITALGCPFVD
jgi:hypothetical protein